MDVHLNITGSQNLLQSTSLQTCISSVNKHQSHAEEVKFQ